MAKIKIFGDSLVLTSDIKAEDIKKLALYKSNALKLAETDGETEKEIFALGFGNKAAFNKFGATFASKNEAGFATMTIAIPVGMTSAEKVDFVKKEYGYALLNLNELERLIAADIDDMAVEFERMEESIQVVE